MFPQEEGALSLIIPRTPCGTPLSPSLINGLELVDTSASRALATPDAPSGKQQQPLLLLSKH